MRKGVSVLIETSLIIYVFAMWKSHVHTDVSAWLTADQFENIKAFAHVRDSAAHKYQGARADFELKRRKLERQMLFAGILWNPETDRKDVSQSSAAMSVTSSWCNSINNLLCDSITTKNLKDPSGYDQITNAT